MKTILLIASAALLLACTSTVTTETNPDSTTTATSTTAGQGGSGAGGSSSTVPAITATTTTGTGMGGASSMSALITGTDPVTLVLTSYPSTCANADMDPPFGQCDWYSVELTFAASFLVPGGQPMSDASSHGFMQGSGDPNSPTPGDCPGTAGVSGGGSGFMPQNLTIVSVDGPSVVVDIEGLSDFLGEGASDASLDGQHTAMRCQ